MEAGWRSPCTPIAPTLGTEEEEEAGEAGDMAGEEAGGTAGEEAGGAVEERTGRGEGEGEGEGVYSTVEACWAVKVERGQRSHGLAKRVFAAARI